jgi:sulfite oxidase
MNKVKKCSGTAWGQGAISTAVWKGPRLADVLKLAGVEQGSAGAESVEHACFKGLDAMAASIPMGKAMSHEGDVILALDMNGKPLVREHGAPLRAVVPGHVGVRNVKWVSEVKLSEEEAVGDWQRGLNYKVLPPGLSSAAGIDVSKVPAMQEASVFSGITGIDDAGGGKVDAKGWAWSGGGRGIARVDVSADGGETWSAATLTEGTDQKRGREWAWFFWEASDVKAKVGTGGEVEVVSRAVDKAYNYQPEDAKHLWNTRGLANNSWYRLKGKVEVDE